MTEQDAAEPDDEPDGTGADAAADPDGTGDAENGSATADADGAEVAGDDVESDLFDRVEESDTEELAREIANLRFERDTLAADIDEYEERVEELESRLKRKQADFENYKKRMEKRREEEKRRATEDLIERLLDVRDNLERALDQDEDADIRDGIEATLREFDRVLDDEGVAVVDPDPGADVDPQRHEVLMRVESDRPGGTVADVHRPGYEMGGKVLRAAQVTVSEGEDGSEEGEDGSEE